MDTTHPIYCVNLAHRVDRLMHSHTQFRRMRMCPTRVVYPHFTKDHRGGVYGCFDSHVRVWRHFIDTFPKAGCCVVFEDDFVANDATRRTMKRAIRFLNRHAAHVDIVFLHDFFVPFEHPLNNDAHFTHGTGLSTVAYVIGRHYIQSVIDKHGRLPDANGRHIDNEICINFTNNENALYTTRAFYSNHTCVTQRIDRSDNYLGMLDECQRVDMNRQLYAVKHLYMQLQRGMGLSESQIRCVAYVFTMAFHGQCTRRDVIALLQRWSRE
jgi:hypothetical protein